MLTCNSLHLPGPEEPGEKLASGKLSWWAGSDAVLRLGWKRGPGEAWATQTIAMVEVLGVPTSE